MQKMWNIQAKEYYAASEKEILSHAVTRMNLKDTVLSKMSQSQKGKHCMILSTGST